VKVGGDLHVEDSSVDHWSMGVGSTYSNVCSSMVLDVGGDLYLTRTNFSEIEQYCRSWSHSSAGEATAYTARVGGDAILEDVVFEGVRLESESSGVYSALLGALLQADGDMTIQGLDIQDSAVVTTMTCQASSCTRVLTGALLQSGGDLSWSAGSIDASPVHLDGTMSGDGSWSDTLWAASIRWSGQTLVLDEVDLGEQPQLDIRGTAEHDGAGKTSLTCTAAGCVEG
jgi:hypothetical protein